MIRLRKYKAFSFLEILFAMVLVVFLAAGAFFGSQHLDSVGRISSCKSKISALMLKVQTEYTSSKVFPNALTDLKNEDTETIKDAWGNVLNYGFGNDYFYIVSNGPNGKAEANISGPFKNSDKLNGDDLGMCFVVEK